MQPGHNQMAIPPSIVIGDKTVENRTVLKKYQMKRKVMYLALSTIAIFVLIGCSKDGNDPSPIELGVWISLDKSDTLDFRTRNDFYKSNGFMQNDHYDYELQSMDSIQIVYSGKLFIMVAPTNHKYSVTQDELTIDFESRSSFGFEDKVITYARE